MLERLKLANFKGWQQLELELAPITLLFGTNSSGKTGVLQSLLLLKQSARGFDPRQHINFGGGDRDYADFGSYQDLVYKHDEDKSVSLGLSWRSSQRQFGFWNRYLRGKNESPENNQEEIVNINYDVTWKSFGDIFIDKLAYSIVFNGNEDHGEHSIQLKRIGEDKYRVFLSESLYGDDANGGSDIPSELKVEDPDIVNSPGSCYMIPFSVGPGNILERTRFPTHFLNFEFEGLIRKFSYLGPLRQYPERYYQWTGERKAQVIEPDGGDTIATLISSERDDKSLQKDVAEWLNKLQLVQAFDVKPTDRNKRFYEVSVDIGGVESALVDVGFGVSQVLPVIALLFSVPSGSIVLLEQPELHLHPNAQSLLADLLLYIASERDVQIIVESHSEHLLRRLQRRIAEENPGFASPENIKMYFCKPGEEGLNCQPVEVDRFGQISNWPENFLGDISGDLHSMVKAALARRKLELAVE